MRVQLGAGDKGRAAAQIIRAVRLRGQRLGGVVGGYAQNFVRPQQRSGTAGRQVALAHMYTVRARGQRNVHVVIHHKGDLPCMAQRRQLPGLGENVGGVQRFFPQLHKGGAAIQRGGHRVHQTAAVQPATVSHGVQTQPGRFQFHKHSSLNKNRGCANTRMAHPRNDGTVFSLRWHYPNQVPWVGAESSLSAGTPAPLFVPQTVYALFRQIARWVLTNSSQKHIMILKSGEPDQPAERKFDFDPLT